MFTAKTLLLVRVPVVLAMFCLPGWVLGQSPELGVPLSHEQVESIDFSVLPDGAGLPPGAGDALAGEPLYRQHCLACHGEDGQDGPNDRLVGGVGSIASAAPVKTVGSYWPYATTVFDYIRRAMPFQTPGSLEPDEIYALTAYLLYANGVIGQQQEMNAQTLPAVQMPNQDGFKWAVPSD